MEHLERQLRDAIDKALESGWSMNALCKAAGVSRPAVRDWYAQYRPVSINLATASKLAVWLGTEFKKPRIKPPDKKKTRTPRNGSVAKRSK